VIDEEKDIRGVISLEDILRLSLPEHILWMDDLSPILDFQPFAELLRNEKGTKITDFMRDDWTAVEDSIPAIQVAKIFLMKEARQILVTRKSKFAGTVSISEFVRKFFWE
jgi:signal-transduction protein with cAMP-binding, CBS, and nucleotidyltransferase domain